MTGFKSKRMLRHADDVTLNHLIELRKLEQQNERLRGALRQIAVLDEMITDEHERVNWLHQRIAIDALKETK